MKNLRNLSKKNILQMTLGLSVAFSAAIGVTPTMAFAASAQTNTANAIIATGKTFMGTPYKFGAKAGDTSSFDCSSFTQYVFKQNGISIPRDSRQQSQVGTYVARNDLQPGDLVFFYSPIHHVAIYIGNGQILHTYGSPGVTISNLNSSWWSSHYTTARRVLPTSSPTMSPAPAPTPTPTQVPTSGSSKSSSPAPTGSNTAGSSFTLGSNASNELNAVESLLKSNGYSSYTKAADWFNLGQTVSKNNLKRGDVLFFSTSGTKNTIEYVGVSLGSDKVLVKNGSTSNTYSLSSSTVQNAFVIAKRYN